MKEQDTQAALDAFPDGMNYQGQYVWDWFTKNSTTIRAALDRIIAEATPSTDALKILRHVNNWSEIETAPKDGTEILLGRFEDGVIEDIIKDYWYEDRVMAAWAEYPAVFDNSPTHWARLPLLLGCSAPKRRDDTQAALDALEELANTRMELSMSDWSRICSTIRAALTAQLTKTDDNVSFPRVANTGDINAEMLEALKECVKALDGGATDAEANIAMIRGYKAIARAEQKGGV